MAKKKTAPKAKPKTKAKPKSKARAKPKSKAKAKGKDKGGAPTKYHERFDEEVFKLCLLGATDEEIASFFNISTTCLTNWKKKYPKFMASIRAGKTEADTEVAKSLYESATGFKITKEIAVKVKKGKGIEELEKITVEEQMPPDYRSISFWLRNRQPEKFREKVDVELAGEVEIIRIIDDIPRDAK